MQNKYIYVALVAILVIAIGSYQFPKVQTQVKEVFGGVSTLEGVDHPFVKINGQRKWYGSKSIVATSSVLCAFQNPYGATTTIEAASLEVTARGTLTQANNLTFSTSTGVYSSSTPALMLDQAMGTGQFSFEWGKNTSTTSIALAPGSTGNANLLAGRTAAGRSNYILGATEWAVWGIATTTGSAGTFVTYPTGECSLVLKKI